MAQVECWKKIYLFYSVLDQAFRLDSFHFLCRLAYFSLASTGVLLDDVASNYEIYDHYTAFCLILLRFTTFLFPQMNDKTTKMTIQNQKWRRQMTSKWLKKNHIAYHT